MSRFLGVVYIAADGGRRELEPQRGSYRVPDRHRQGIRQIISENSQDMKGKMSHITNHCQGKNMVEYCDSLACRPSQSGRTNNLAIRLEHIFLEGQVWYSMSGASLPDGGNGYMTLTKFG